MEELSINGEAYGIEVAICRLIEDKYQQITFIPFDQISNIDLMNDLFEPLTTMKMYVKDPDGSNLLKYSQDGLTVVVLKIRYIPSAIPGSASGGGDSQPIEYEEHFIINSLSVKTQSPEETFLEITGCNLLVPYWLASPYYSTKWKEPVSVTEIIEDIFMNSKIPFRGSTSNNSTINSNVSKMIRDIQLDHTDQKINFICPINETMQNIMKYLQLQAISKDKGIYFIPYSMLDKEFRLLSLKQLMSSFNVKELKTYQYFVIQSKNAFAPITNAALNITSSNYYSAILAYDMAHDLTINKFDYMKKEWSKDEYAAVDMNKFLPISDDNMFQNTVKPVPSAFMKQTGMKFTSQKQPQKYMYLTNKILNYMRLNQVVQFDCLGYMKREVGELVYLSTGDMSSQVAMKFNGPWLISRVYHTFSKSTYNQNISVIRAEAPTEQVMSKQEQNDQRMFNSRGQV